MTLAVVALSWVILAVILLRPACVPLSADDLRSFDGPLEHRTDRDFYLQVFQWRNGQWFQCKTWMSRHLFFQD